MRVATLLLLTGYLAGLAMGSLSTGHQPLSVAAPPTVEREPWVTQDASTPQSCRRAGLIEEIYVSRTDASGRIVHSVRLANVTALSVPFVVILRPRGPALPGMVERIDGTLRPEATRDVTLYDGETELPISAIREATELLC